jgi:hypothetical protein
MPIKCYRTNTDFDLKHFVASEAHTPDGKHVLWTSQLNMLSEQYGGFKAMMLRKEAREEELLEMLAATDAHLISQAREKMMRAELMEIQAGQENDRLNELGGKQEIQTIRRLIEENKPKCKYLHFDLLDQQEAIQEEEWLCELQSRARKHIACTGSIPVDQLSAMMAHPKFVTHVKPVIEEALQSSMGDGAMAALSFSTVLQLR